jgi:hypothetical protein
LPRLAFIAPDDFAIPANLRESDESFERQKRFRRTVMDDCVAASFDSPERLASKVTQALANWSRKKGAAPQTGVAKLAEKPTGPASGKPRKFGANPYRGLESFRKEHPERFFGREATVDQLWKSELPGSFRKPCAAPPAQGRLDRRQLRSSARIVSCQLL